MADEYIERQKAIFPLYRWKNIIKNTYGENDEYVRCLTEAIEKIENVPTADVAPVRHGRWISDSPGKRFGTVVRLDKDGCPVSSCHCSECGEWLTASDEYPVIGYYCPNCGAKMDGGKT